ncbi:hypothetical protein, partial [Ruegeria marisrubri]|uniref:hypothetical protein n=1 Tax=Ruegeria marisrubri TaxID=1685379 RepID=UPI0012FDFDBC
MSRLTPVTESAPPGPVTVMSPTSMLAVSMATLSVKVTVTSVVVVPTWAGPISGAEADWTTGAVLSPLSAVKLARVGSA